MSREYLIDGYNLLHAFGLIPHEDGPRGLEKARGQMLRLLAHALQEAVCSTTVVFDAKTRSRGKNATAEYRGITVIFAAGYDEADTLIEELIRKHSSPRKLTVVSDDHRVQTAGQRRRCRVIGCEEFIRELEKPRDFSVAETKRDSEKKANLSKEEKQHWLEAFDDLQYDPAMKELFDPFDFGEIN